MPSSKNKKAVKQNEDLTSMRKMLWMDDIPTELLYREEELARIEKFCRLFIEKKDDSYSLYLGGVPGTGKTSCVLQTISNLKKDKQLTFKFVHLNGGELVRPEDLYVKFYHEFHNSKTRIAASNARQQLTTIFRYSDSTRPPTILLLDELDFLVNKNQTVIYDVFDLASAPEARLAIISITNTFDFTSRVLDSRIQSRIGTNRLHFQPYDWKQIQAILGNRLVNCANLIDKSALRLAAGKVANMSGDIRKALDILRRAIDIAIKNDEETLTMKEVDEACKESKSTYRMCLVRSMSPHELRFFRAVYNDLFQSSLQESLFGHIYRHYERLCADDDVESLNVDEVMRFVQDGVETGFYNLSKAPGSFHRKISLGLAVYEAKFCLDRMSEHEN